MLDHAFMTTVETLRRSMADALLDRDSGDERLQMDILGGDLSWESSCTLPGEVRPARVRADITLDWPTWSQTSLRAWQMDGELEEPPELLIEVALRLQTLAHAPDLPIIGAALDAEGPELGGEALRRCAPHVEQNFDSDLESLGWIVEFAYDGAFEFTESILADTSGIATAFAGFGPWLASILVRLGDLHLAFVPPDEADPHPGR